MPKDGTLLAEDMVGSRRVACLNMDAPYLSHLLHPLLLCCFPVDRIYSEPPDRVSPEFCEIL